MSDKKCVADWKKIIAIRLKSLRKDMGLTQAELAERANVATRSIVCVENEKPNMRPCEKIIVRLAQATDNKPQEWLDIMGSNLTAEQVLKSLKLTSSRYYDKDITNIVKGVLSIDSEPLIFSELLWLLNIQDKLGIVLSVDMARDVLIQHRKKAQSLPAK